MDGPAVGESRRRKSVEATSRLAGATSESAVIPEQPVAVTGERLGGNQDLSDEMKAIVGRTPVGRLEQPEDIAQLVVFLCSDAADLMVGEIITLDGGYVLGGDPIVEWRVARESRKLRVEGQQG